MKDRAGLILWLAAVVGLTLVHDPAWLAVAALLWFLLAGREAPRLAGRALLAVLVFNATVSVGYAALALIRGEFSWLYLIRTNLRVWLITACTFLMAKKVNLFAALSFAPGLMMVLLLAHTQIRVFTRLLEDFRLGLRSRSLRRPTPRVLYGHGAATGSFFLSKAVHDAGEIGLAMQARGLFRDRSR